MNSKEEKKIPQMDDFEIIDIPMDNGSEINDNINIANNISQIEQPIEINTIEPSSMNQNVQTTEINSFNNTYQDEAISDQPETGMAQINIENSQETGYTSSYNEMNQNSGPTSFNEIPQQTSEFNQQSLENNIFVENNTIDNNINYNPVENPQMNIEDNINPETIDQNINMNTNVEQSQNVYIPKKEVKTEQKEVSKMDKSVKEIITMGVIVAVVILLLPTLYNLSTGKYNVMSNLKNTFGGLFGKEEKTTSKETLTEDETTEEDVVEEETEQENGSGISTLSFDFTSYNNQVIDSNALTTLLDSYKNNVISLSPTVENGKQVYKIEIAKDVASAEYSISNPASALESFSKQYLFDNSNYLINVGSVNDNIIVLSATKQ